MADASTPLVGNDGGGAAGASEGNHTNGRATHSGSDGDGASLAAKAAGHKGRGSTFLSPALLLELRAWSALAWPVSLTILARLSQIMTDVSFLGHLGTEELAGGSLALVWMVVTSTFVWQVRCVCVQAGVLRRRS